MASPVSISCGKGHANWRKKRGRGLRECRECSRIRLEKWRLNNPARIKKYIAIYSKTEGFKKRNHARSKVKDALKWGHLKRKPCIKCANVKSEAHHPNYSMPLRVVWLCRTHHVARHQILRRRKK